MIKLDGNYYFNDPGPRSDGLEAFNETKEAGKILYLVLFGLVLRTMLCRLRFDLKEYLQPYLLDLILVFQVRLKKKLFFKIAHGHPLHI